MQVPHTSMLERFLDAEDLRMGRCKDVAMDPGAFEQEAQQHGSGSSSISSSSSRNKQQ